MNIRAGPDLRGGVEAMGPGGFEPPTSPLSGARSDQLSYEPEALQRELRNGQYTQSDRPDKPGGSADI